MKEEHKTNKPFQRLTASLIGVAVVVVCLFVFLAFFMNQKSSDTIQEVGRIYMTGMSEQISLHYETTIELRLSQVQALVDTTTSKTVSSHEELVESLEVNARARGYEYLALYSSDGEFEMIYGDKVNANEGNALDFLANLQKGDQRVVSGQDSKGNNVVLFGVPCNYPMTDGGTSVALVGGLSSDYMSTVLFLDKDATFVYSYIIRRDGTFVIRSGEAFQENYFDQLHSVFDNRDEEEAKRHIEELSAAMEKGEDYTVVLHNATTKRHLYCSKLPYSEWYLVTVLPYDPISNVVNEMSRQWTYMVYVVCCVVFAALLVLFIQYFNITKRQLEAMRKANRESEEARQEAEHANKAKSEFLSNMSHDIRTPMNAIVGMTAIATANLDNQEQVQNCLKKIALSSKHLLGLINDVLDMSKIESGKMTLNVDQVSLREVMDSMVNIVQPQVKAKDQKFNIFTYDISTENVCCDSVRLNQVLINLLGNAVKFTPNGGTIQVTLYEEPSPKGEDYIRTHLLVKDTGIGMSKEYQDKIFESFSREDRARVQKTEGTGLGMTITKYIVDAMGGTIGVTSEPGKGSEFHVTLDLEKAQIQEADMVLPDWKMLVVDDDRQLCESVADALKSIGVKPDWCMDSRTAIKMVEEHHACHDDYQIILLDWKLPDMDGISTAREIRHRYGTDIPILLISAYDWGEIEEEAKEAGVTGFISKPLFRSTLFYGLKSFAGECKEEILEAASGAGKVDFGGLHVLLAEDNDLNWEIAEELLSDLGLELEWAENGQICVEKFRQSPEGFFGAILMDIRMPVMNGYEATQEIRTMKRPDANIPIIAMTADAFSEDIQRCLECGMNAHVAKPIDVREVTRHLEKFIK